MAMRVRGARNVMAGVLHFNPRGSGGKEPARGQLSSRSGGALHEARQERGDGCAANGAVPWALHSRCRRARRRLIPGCQGALWVECGLHSLQPAQCSRGSICPRYGARILPIPW